MRPFLAALAFAGALHAVPAVAKPSHPVTAFQGDRYVSVAMMSANEVANATKRKARPRVRRHHAARHPANVQTRQMRPRRTIWAGFKRELSQVVGGRPAGCPARFCGCGASLHLFGRIIPSLNLAANWLRFPRAAPAPDMVAARRGHVFVLKQHIAGNIWLAFDANSGGRRTRIHPRSIAGFVIVNPRGA